MGDLEASARRAMLARLAGDLNVIAHADRMPWTCCELEFTHHGDPWLWRFCSSAWPGGIARTCPHWHHQHEPPTMAVA